MSDDPYRPGMPAAWSANATVRPTHHGVPLTMEPLDGPALIRAARIAAGETLEEFGRRAGVPTRTLSRYENRHAVPRSTTLARLARAAGVPMERLLAGAA